jgi:hypothetical protein
MGFVVDKTALGQIVSEYSGFSCQSFHRLFDTLYHKSSSGVGTVAQEVASVIVVSVPLHLKK